MNPLTSVYESVFKKIRGKGLGLGLFNWLHKTVYEDWLQPAFVEIEGFKLFLPRHDVGVSDFLRMSGSYEPEMTAEFKKTLQPGMTFLDVGANIGYYTVLGSRLVGAKGRVLAFEPEPGNLALLRKNLKVNGCENVEVFPMAAGDAPGEAVLNLDTSNTGAHSIAHVPDAAGRAAFTVPVARLDDVLKAEQRPDVVKMDVEGAEAAALDGMPRLLKDPHLQAIFVECNPDILSKLGGSEDGILDRIRRHGFTPRRIDRLNVVCQRAI